LTGVGSNEVLPADLIRSAVHERPLGLYVHVPFCARRCGYCAFTTYALGDDGDVDAQDRYVEAALAELAVADRVLGTGRPPLTSAYLGGGTPTMLTTAQLARLLDGVRHRFELAEGAEISIEANPDGLRPGQLAELRELGATRVSFGMQSLSRRVLRTLDRTHDPERALAAVGEARAAGFEHVSLDLIYGTPGETAQDWERTLREVVATGVDHVSAYALGIEPGTKLAARVRHGEVPTPDADAAADRYLVADATLAAAGFEWYELSNWARSVGARSRHNLLYWRNDSWWGVGPGAHSHVGGVRWWNHTGLEAWTRAAADGVPAAGHEVLGAGQRELERVLLGVRLSDGLPLDDRLDAQGLERLLDAGLVAQQDDCVVATLEGRLLADHLVRELTG
jgi:putative oxygen-independent coproporphyrinogen III oxidase